MHGPYAQDVYRVCTGCARPFDRLQGASGGLTFDVTDPEDPATMPITARQIEDLLRQDFPDAQITVDGDDGAHFAAQVIDESFRGLNRVQQQRAVYAALKGRMDGSNGELHALALTTKAPD